MSAETLRQAAALMRERAEAAICPCGGPVCNVECGWFGFAELNARFDDWVRPVEHIHAWSPAVALAVADWLDATADDAARRAFRVTKAIGCEVSTDEVALPQHALAVARAYLGGDA